MSDIPLAEAKAHLSALVERAGRGEVVRITRRGKPVALLTPIDRPRKPIDVAALRALTESMRRPDGSPPPESIVRQMRDDERY